MYENLKHAMTIKRIASKQIADLLNVSEKTMYNKLHGNSEWTYNEIMKLKTFVFPEYDIEWLFALNDKTA
ncbi:MAG: hypothetical protein ACI4RF_08120 [Eubacterium sp.]